MLDHTRLLLFCVIQEFVHQVSVVDHGILNHLGASISELVLAILIFLGAIGLNVLIHVLNVLIESVQTQVIVTLIINLFD